MIWPQPGMCGFLSGCELWSLSMNQSSNFVESCPSNVWISWSMVGEIRFSLCHMQDVCLCLDGFMHWLLSSLGGTGWSVMVRCCSTSVGVD